MKQRSRKILLKSSVLFALLVALFLILFQWDWLRVPIQDYITRKTGREFRMSHFDVELGRYPKLILTDVRFQNADWSKEGQDMANIGKLEFTVSPRDLFDHKVVLPRLALSNAKVVMEELKDGRRNWIFSDPNDKSETAFRVSTLSVDHGSLRYINHGSPFQIDINADTFDPSAPDVTKADVAAANRKLTTRYTFNGHYRDAGFKGNAYTGDVLSFQESEIPFPIRGSLQAGTTRLDVDGSVADAVKISAIDTYLHISGQTLANLYPFLLLPLPASPPYDVKGRLKLQGNHFTMDDLAGKIGSSDISGKGSYLRREPRPLLQAQLHSKLLNLEDLGPLVGLKTKGSAASERPTQAATATRAVAQDTEQKTSGGRILPTGTFESTRIRAIDADVSLDAAKLLGPDELALETFYASLHVKDGQVKLTPLQFGFAGGRMISTIAIDARNERLKGSADVDFRHIEIAKLFPTMPKVAQGAGTVGAQIRLRGEGNNVADLLGSSNGTVGAAISGGQISNLLDAAVGLNGGRALPLLVGGDKEIPIRCGGMAFDVKNGLATSTMFVIDTEQTRIDGAGTIDMKNERFDLNFSPKPKKMSLLSLRTPIRVYGTFRHADYSLDKGVLAARAGGALALAAVSPFAVLLPLFETGPGKDTDCAALLAPVEGAQQQADSKKAAAPTPLTANRPKAANQARATGDAQATAKVQGDNQKKAAENGARTAPEQAAQGRGKPQDNKAVKQALKPQPTQQARRDASSAKPAAANEGAKEAAARDSSSSSIESAPKRPAHSRWNDESVPVVP